jgi:hypothetical protein
MRQRRKLYLLTLNTIILAQRMYRAHRVRKAFLNYLQKGNCSQESITFELKSLNSLAKIPDSEVKSFVLFRKHNTLQITYPQLDSQTFNNWKNYKKVCRYLKTMFSSQFYEISSSKTSISFSLLPNFKDICDLFQN